MNFGVRPLQLLPKPSEARGSEQVWPRTSYLDLMTARGTLAAQRPAASVS